MSEHKFPEPIRAFAEFANTKGYDIAYTYDTDRSRWVFFSAATSHAWQFWQEATRLAMERCEKECERIHTEYRDAYKGRGDEIKRDQLYNPHTDGCSDGAFECASAIRDLLDTDMRGKNV